VKQHCSYLDDYKIKLFSCYILMPHFLVMIILQNQLLVHSWPRLFYSRPALHGIYLHIEKYVLPGNKDTMVTILTLQYIDLIGCLHTRQAIMEHFATTMMVVTIATMRNLIHNHGYTPTHFYTASYTTLFC